MTGHNLGVRETVSLVVILCCAKVFLGFPRMMVERGATAAWLVVLISMIHGPLLWLALRGVLRLHPGKSLITATEAILGPVIGSFVNVAYFGFFIYLTSVVLRLFSESIVIVFLPTTPVLFVVLIMLITIIYIVYLGMEAATRTAWLVAPYMLIGYAVLLLGALKTHAEPQALAPYWGPGPAEVFRWGLVEDLKGEMLVFGVIAPSFRTPNLLARAFWWTILLSVVILVGTEIIYEYVFPYPTSTEVILPLLQVTRAISVGPGIQRIEAMFFVIWLLGGVLKLVAALYGSVSTLAQSLRLPRYRHLLPALGVLTFSAALAPRSVMEAIRLDAALREYGGIVTTLLPLLTWGVGLLRRKRGVTRATG